MFNSQSFIEEVKSRSGQPIELCFQCQKCASGCYMARFTDHAPNQILRYIQLGLKEKALRSSMIWLCSSCEICGSRCPNGIKMFDVMDALKKIAISNNIVAEKKIRLFNDIFLDTVRSKGRIHEALMMAEYKLRTGDLFSDLDLGLKLFLKRKLPLIGKKVKDRKYLDVIFKRCFDMERKAFAKYQVRLDGGKLN